MDRYLPRLATTVHGNGGEIVVRTSTIVPSSRDEIERDDCAVITAMGLLSLYLTPSAAIDLGNALVQAGHHYRAHATAHFDELAQATGEAA